MRRPPRQTPFVLPSRPSSVSIGEDEGRRDLDKAGGAVTEVRMGITPRK